MEPNNMAGSDIRTYEFDVILRQVSKITDDQADRLFAAGCDDATPASADGIAWLHFDREAQSLEEAIRSAVGNVQSAGFLVGKIELDIESGVLTGP